MASNRFAAAVCVWILALAGTGIGQDSRENAADRGPGTAFLKSLVLPGWGQHSLGAKTSARTFLVAEIAFLGAAIAFNEYSGWLEGDFSAYAARHAAVREPESKSEQYWVDIGNFDSIFEFNDEKLRQRNTRDLRPTDGTEFWTWESPENREIFESLRIRRDRASERSQFAVVGVLTNHLVSAIHTLWVARRTRNATSPDTEAALRWRYTPLRDGAKLRVQWRF